MGGGTRSFLPAPWASRVMPGPNAASPCATNCGEQWAAGGGGVGASLPPPVIALGLKFVGSTRTKKSGGCGYGLLGAQDYAVVLRGDPPPPPFVLLEMEPKVSPGTTPQPL